MPLTLTLKLRSALWGSGGSFSREGGSSFGAMKGDPPTPAAATTMSMVLRGENVIALLKAAI